MQHAFLPFISHQDGKPIPDDYKLLSSTVDAFEYANLLIFKYATDIICALLFIDEF